MKKQALIKISFAALRIIIALAILFVCGFICFRSKPPISLQTLGLFFISYLLIPSEALIASLLYVLLGAVGLPVFAGVTGGIDVLLGASGGFLVSFPIIAFISSITLRKRELTAAGLIIFFSSMTLLSYIFGATWIIYRGFIEGGFFKIMLHYILPFVPLDALKVVAISKIILAIRKKSAKNAKNNT